MSNLRISSKEAKKLLGEKHFEDMGYYFRHPMWNKKVETIINSGRPCTGTKVVKVLSHQTGKVEYWVYGYAHDGSDIAKVKHFLGRID